MTHPITPPPELVLQWLGTYFGITVISEVSGVELALATRAAQWGADQELEACCDWVEDECPGYGSPYEKLRAARRPKPPSLKEQALTALHAIATGANDTREQHQDFDTLRRALEQLDD